MSWQGRGTESPRGGCGKRRRSGTTTCLSSSSRTACMRTLPASIRRTSTTRRMPDRGRRPRWTSGSRLGAQQKSRRAFGGFLPLWRSRLLGEGGDGGGLVVLDVEDGVELGDLEEVVDLLGQVEELELAACILDGGERGDHLPDA